MGTERTSVARDHYPYGPIWENSSAASVLQKHMYTNLHILQCWKMLSLIPTPPTHTIHNESLKLKTTSAIFIADCNAHVSGLELFSDSSCNEMIQLLMWPL